MYILLILTYIHTLKIFLIHEIFFYRNMTKSHVNVESTVQS